MSRYKVKRKLNLDKTEVICPVCDRAFLGSRSLKNHITQMHSGKPKDTSNRGKPKGTDAWNKGLTKETSEDVKRISEKNAVRLQKMVEAGTYIPIQNGESWREKTSLRQSTNNSGGKSKWYNVANQKVQGTYEKQFAERLEAESIIWIKVNTHNHIFRYEQNGKLRSYAPDFFLPELNLYVEIKGYWWGNDEEKMNIIKMSHSDKNVVVLFGKQKLDRICENIKEKLPLEPVWSW